MPHTTTPAPARAAFADEPPRRAADVVSAGGSRTWSVCGRNFAVSLTELAAGDRLDEHGVPDEYALLVTDGTGVVVEHADAGAAAVAEPAFVVVPAGSSSVRSASPSSSTGPTTVVRVFSALYPDAMRRAVNHTDGADPRTAPLPARPAAGGGRIAVHPLRAVPEEDGRLGRIFRTASLMVNWFPDRTGPRDPEALSPHSHVDFEQLSLTLHGDHVHHFRTPWTPRMSEWRDDQQVDVGSPSMVLIPPTVVHTTRAVGEGRHSLVDVFAPPRADFLAHGWVLNAADYPGAPS